MQHSVWLALILVVFSFPVHADALDTGDTAWILTATALVLFMTIPGLSLFYGGLVRAKNVLSVLMQCFTITCMVSVLWLTVGYSLAFSDGGSVNAFIGGLSNAFFTQISEETVRSTVPESAFALFQMTFAIITPALIVGGFAERIRFPAMLIFSAAWLLLSMYRYATGYGVAAGLSNWGSWIPPAASWCTLPPGSRHWWRRLCWVAGAASRPRPCHRTTCP